MQIPGFHYDPDKNRYFKIVTNDKTHVHSKHSIQEKAVTPLSTTTSFHKSLLLRELGCSISRRLPSLVLSNWRLHQVSTVGTERMKFDRIALMASETESHPFFYTEHVYDIQMGCITQHSKGGIFNPVDADIPLENGARHSLTSLAASKLNSSLFCVCATTFNDTAQQITSRIHVGFVSRSDTMAFDPFRVATKDDGDTVGRCCGFSGSRLVVGSANSNLRHFYDASRPSQSKRVTISPSKADILSLTLDNLVCVAGSRNGSVISFDFGSNREVGCVSSGNSAVSCVTTGPNCIATGLSSGVVNVWDKRFLRNPLHSLEGCSNYEHDLRVVDNVLVSVSEVGILRLWNLDSGVLLKRVRTAGSRSSFKSQLQLLGSNGILVLAGGNMELYH